jgi:hypothetical protein
VIYDYRVVRRLDLEEVLADGWEPTLVLSDSDVVVRRLRKYREQALALPPIARTAIHALRIVARAGDETERTWAEGVLVDLEAWGDAPTTEPPEHAIPK